MVIKAILFDMDGVLIDAREWHYDALNKALDHFGYFISRESHLSTFEKIVSNERKSAVVVFFSPFLKTSKMPFIFPFPLGGVFWQVNQQYR